VRRSATCRGCRPIGRFVKLAGCRLHRAHVVLRPGAGYAALVKAADRHGSTRVIVAALTAGLSRAGAICQVFPPLSASGPSWGWYLQVTAHSEIATAIAGEVVAGETGLPGAVGPRGSIVGDDAVLDRPLPVPLSNGSPPYQWQNCCRSWIRNGRGNSPCQCRE
jgi:hypothetical protein